jgi:hypothetical protein
MGLYIKKIALEKADLSVFFDREVDAISLISPNVQRVTMLSSDQYL